MSSSLLAGNSTLARSLSEQIAQQLGEQILSGALVPGQLLPDEQALCDEFGVSRTAVREAVKMLVAKGMLEVRQRIGTRVQSVRSWQLLDRDVLSWHQSIGLESDRLLRLMELRLSIEPDAACYAAERRTDEDLQEIFGAIDAMAEHAVENERYVLADAEFHVAVLRAAHNPYLDALENAIFTGLLLSIRVTNPDSSQNLLSIPFHQKIGDAIRRGDGQAASDAMKVHLEDASRRLSAVI
ncbi:FadR/GntR family transcriptional regulator [Ruegeria jejuensis]|uniref:FadR/GntR family transcriptional regulator n=1 Tax=Ruegeria jejuensis TaxID=3233338 RepID=UPI00355B4708